jgi:hypothetical protein
MLLSRSITTLVRQRAVPNAYALGGDAGGTVDDGRGPSEAGGAPQGLIALASRLHNNATAHCRACAAQLTVPCDALLQVCVHPQASTGATNQIAVPMLQLLGNKFQEACTAERTASNAVDLARR